MHCVRLHSQNHWSSTVHSMIALLCWYGLMMMMLMKKRDVFIMSVHIAIESFVLNAELLGILSLLVKNIRNFVKTLRMWFLWRWLSIVAGKGVQIALFMCKSLLVVLIFNAGEQLYNIYICHHYLFIYKYINIYILWICRCKCAFCYSCGSKLIGGGHNFSGCVKNNRNLSPNGLLGFSTF